MNKILVNQVWNTFEGRVIVGNVMTGCSQVFCVKSGKIEIWSNELISAGTLVDQSMKPKQYIYCPDCQTKHTLEFWMKSWAGFKCDSCGNYIVISEQLHFTEKLEAHNV